MNTEIENWTSKKSNSLLNERLENCMLFDMQVDLEKEEFKFNPYDPCVADCYINNQQHTISRFHVDDLIV